MRPISRQVLAKQLANDIARSATAACRGQWQWWSAREAEHVSASSAAAAAAAAAPAMALCARCPIVDACRELAELDEYTGLAAGSAWLRGVHSPTSRLPNAHLGRMRLPAQQVG